MNIEFEIEEEYFDRAEKAECQVAFLGLVTRARLLTVFVAGMSPVDFEEARADLMAKMREIEDE